MFIMSIDPGINNTGISILDLSDSFTVLDTVLVNNNRKLTEEEKILEKKLGIRAIKVLSILNIVENLINKYDIKTIIIEAPFYNAITPMAYSSLLEVTFAIKYSLVTKLNIEFKSIEPLLIKKMFTNNSLASKQAMKQFLITKKNNNDIKIDKDIESLSEHEIDSIAIGYTYYMSLSSLSNE